LIEGNLMSVNIDKVFEIHYEYYMSVGIETIQQQAGQVEQVGADYQGRVIYELLQNAFDKAERNIRVLVRDGHLFLANDGEAFTYQSGYDYKDGSTLRADFQSLCSISTSSKDMNKSIGNKGVGFKSVFSISESDFVYIHTKGTIRGKNDSIVETDLPVSFKIYESFKEISQIPQELPEVVKNKLRSQISLATKFSNKRGVPGYYYPVKVIDTNTIVRQLFAEGYVTMVQIPINERQRDNVKKLFEEIKLIHFHFVKLRVAKPIVISFSHESDSHLSFEKSVDIEDHTSYFVSSKLKPIVKNLAHNAGIAIDKPMVALYFDLSSKSKDLSAAKQEPVRENHGKLYNYLPTIVRSPFRKADFHADFHTTVDRTGVNWEMEIGKYNKALLHACLELYFVSLNSFLESHDRVDLKLQYLDLDIQQQARLPKFMWSYLDGNKQLEIYEMVRFILDIDYDRYENVSVLFARLASKYFKSGSLLEDSAYHSFYNNSIKFVHEFSRYANLPYSYQDRFKLELVKQLKAVDAKIIPNTINGPVSINNELIHRDQKSNEESKGIPAFVGINITDFKIQDEPFRKILGIKEFSDRNEILKYYRQVSPIGEVKPASSACTEKQQQELLESFAYLLSKPDPTILCTHRYDGFINRPEKSINTAANFADFSISTLFLKSKNGKYFPAQLCHRRDLDLDFLPSLPFGLDVNIFLQYLGVSIHDHVRFVDKLILKNLASGLDYIPSLWKRPDEEADALRHGQILANIRILHKSKIYKPALINDNPYGFLRDLKIAEFREEARQLRVKDYDRFPKQYYTQLKEEFEKNVSQQDNLIRLYQKTFEGMHRELGVYLVAKDFRLSFESNQEQFNVTANETDFQLVRKSGQPVLCYYSAKINPRDYGLKGHVINLKESAVFAANESDVTLKFQKLLNDKIFYLLVELSEFKLSEADYFENPESIKELAKRLSALKYKEADLIEREVTSPFLESPIREFREFDVANSIVYLRQGSKNTNLAKAISMALFRNLQFARVVELIVFHIDIPTLKNDYQVQTKLYRQIFDSYWIDNYHSKFLSFTRALLLEFNISTDSIEDKWYVFNSSFQSKVIREIYLNGNFPKLNEAIYKEREPFLDGLFRDFTLQVDFHMYDLKLATLMVIADKYQGTTIFEIKKSIESLYGKICIEQDILTIENKITTNFPGAFDNKPNQGMVKGEQRDIELKNRISRIYDNLNLSNRQVRQEELGGESILAPIFVNTKKVIYEGKETDFKDHVITGESGEEEVLNYFINQFLSIDSTEKKINALKEIWELIISKLANNEKTITRHKLFYMECIAAVDHKDDLGKALIPFFYITLHYKFAYIDMFVWTDNRPFMVEVKTTRYRANNTFKISSSEINAALANDNYMIVRVTPDAVNFLGNPIKLVKDKINLIRGQNYEMIPDGFTFRLTSLNT
jgi:hypothetical protein